MSRAEDNSRSVSGMTLNDDRLFGEQKRHSEPSVAVMGKCVPIENERRHRERSCVLCALCLFYLIFHVPLQVQIASYRRSHA